MNLAQRVEHVDRSVAARQALRQDRQRRVDGLVKAIQDLEAESKEVEEAENILIELGKRTVSDSTETLNKLVTLGLKSVFPDQELELKTTVDRSRGKTSIRFDLYDRGRTFPIEDAFGGGVLAIAGLLLRVSIITTLKLRRVLFLDETLAHVAVEYIPAASKLLRKIADDLDFTILLVSHQQEFAQAAHKHFKAIRKGGITVITPVRHGNNPG